MDLDNVFGNVANAQDLGGFTRRLPIGQHTVLLTKFNVKESAKGNGKIVEADFHVLESNSAIPNETRGWAWFIGMQGWAGKYEASRLKEFIETLAAGIGDTRGVQAVGADLAGPGQAGRGLMLKCVVSPQENTNGSPKVGKDGRTYTEIRWVSVTQGLEDIKKARALLDSAPAPAAPAPAPAQAAQQQTQAAAQPEPKQDQPGLTAQAGGGGLTALLGSLSTK